MSTSEADDFIECIVSAVKKELPELLLRMHERDQTSVPLFHAMCHGGDELATAAATERGLLAAAKHVLDRGGEIVKDFSNRPTLEFRFALAYTKFEERAKQMRQVLRCVFQTDESFARHEHTSSSSSSSEETHAKQSRSSLLTQALQQPETFRVLSLGGGPGNDMVGVLSFLMERNAKCGVRPSVLSIPLRYMTVQRPQKLTKADKKAAKRAGINVHRTPPEATQGIPTPYSSFSVSKDFVNALPKQAIVTPPETCVLAACKSAHGLVFDIDDQWFPIAGNVVQRCTAKYFGDLDTAFGSLSWHRCDVTRSLDQSFERMSLDTKPKQRWTAFRTQPQPHPEPEPQPEPETKALQPPDVPSVQQTDFKADTTNAEGCSLIVESYLFSAHPSPGGGEVPVSKDFWSALLKANPTAWFVFVEGCISKKTWQQLFQIFAEANRAMTPPINIKGELLERVVAPHPPLKKQRNYCYWFSPPPARAAPPPSSASGHAD